ncbi:MAG: hypothetical protein ABIJ34_00975 [archaeon]
MRKAQLSVFVIFGLLIMLAILIFLSNPPKIQSSVIEFSTELGRLGPYFRECCKLSMLDANSRYGLHSSTKDDYEPYLIAKVDDCMSPFLQDIAVRGMDVERVDTPSALLEINDLNAIVTIKYPVKVSTKSDSYIFPDYVQKFERVTIIDEKNINNAVSADTNFILSAPDGIRIYGPYDEEFANLYIKVSDKREIGCDELLGNLVYGVYPLGYYSDEPITIKLDIDKIAPWLTDRDKLRIAWQDPDSKKCTFLENSKYKDGMLQADTKYITFFGIGKPSVSTSGYPYQSTGEGTSGSFNTPAGDFEPVQGTAQVIYDGIKAEMGGTYSLFKNNECVPPGAYCFTGWSARCPNGEAAIYCNDAIYSIDEGALNTLFRHEITHNLQQNNKCAFDTAKSEWGAEYYSGSNYYNFAITSPTITRSGMSAAEVGTELEKAGCIKSELLDAAFCKGGNIGSYTQKCDVEITGYS